MPDQPPLQPDKSEVPRWTSDEWNGFRAALRIRYRHEGMRKAAARDKMREVSQNMKMRHSFEEACRLEQFDAVAVRGMRRATIRVRDGKVETKPLPPVKPEQYRAGDLSHIDWVYENLWRYRAWKDWKPGTEDIRPPQVTETDAPTQGAWGLLMYAYANWNKFYEMWQREKNKKKDQEAEAKSGKVDGVDLLDLVDRYGRTG